MKLLLDEMISPKIARELRGRGDFDVQAIKGDRPDLEAVADREIVRRIAAEQRTLVTNDVLDFQLIHNQMLAAGEEHYGLIFTSDSTMPRNKALANARHEGKRCNGSLASARATAIRSGSASARSCASSMNRRRQATSSMHPIFQPCRSSTTRTNGRAGR